MEKCLVLKGREIMLYPDLEAFDRCSQKAVEIQKNIIAKSQCQPCWKTKQTNDIEQMI